MRAVELGQGKSKHFSAQSGVQFQDCKEPWEQLFLWRLRLRLQLSQTPRDLNPEGKPLCQGHRHSAALLEES